jgi:hypothetical protein
MSDIQFQHVWKLVVGGKLFDPADGRSLVGPAR